MPIDDFILPPRGESKIEDFDLKAHIEDEIVPVDDPDASSAPDDDFEEEEIPKFRKVVPRIHEIWIQLTPSMEDFITLINKTFD